MVKGYSFLLSVRTIGIMLPLSEVKRPLETRGLSVRVERDRPDNRFRYLLWCLDFRQSDFPSSRARMVVDTLDGTAFSNFVLETSTSAEPEFEFSVSDFYILLPELWRRIIRPANAIDDLGIAIIVDHGNDKGIAERPIPPCSFAPNAMKLSQSWRNRVGERLNI